MRISCVILDGGKDSGFVLRAWQAGLTKNHTPLPTVQSCSQVTIIQVIPLRLVLSSF
jgi:hypothetical protein